MKKILVFALLAALAIGVAVAQTTAVQDITIVVPQIRLIRLVSDTMITLTVGGAAGTPGAAPTGETKTDADELQYTVLNPTGTTQHITVQLTAGTIPAGTSLTVGAADASPLGTIVGTVASPITISGTAQEFIQTIGSGYTGTGAGSGAMLTYVLGISNATLLEVNAGADLDVTYTIEDDV